jgi:ankyrin repeat protein
MDIVTLLGGVEITITKGVHSGTPLLWALVAMLQGKEGGVELAKLLVENGTDVNAVMKAHGTCPETLESISIPGVPFDGVQEVTPLLLALVAVSEGTEGSVELAQLLLKTGADANPVMKGEGVELTPLGMALMMIFAGDGGSMELVKLLVENGADVSAIIKVEGVEITILGMASGAVCEGREGGVELMKLLVANGADVNAVMKVEGVDLTPLGMALEAVFDGKEGGVKLAKLLVENGADVNAVNAGMKVEGVILTPLGMALGVVSDGKEGGVKLARLLVESGADVNAVTVFAYTDETKDDGTEGTPLMWAAKAMRDNRADDVKDLVRFLSSNRANLADGEKDEWQGIIDGVMGVSANRNKSRV